MPEFVTAFNLTVLRRQVIGMPKRANPAYRKVIGFSLNGTNQVEVVLRDEVRIRS